MRQVLFALLLLFGLHSNAADLGNQFVTARLAYGVSVSIPRSWQVLRGNEKKAVETIVGATVDLSGYTKLVQGSEIIISANFPDPTLYAGLSITSIPIRNMTPSFASSLSDSQLKSGETSTRQAIETGQSQLGIKVFGWTPMRKMNLGPNAVLYTSYMRNSTAGDTRVHMYKFFARGRVFDVMLSTRVAVEQANRPILKRIVQSVVVPR